MLLALLLAGAAPAQQTSPEPPPLEEQPGLTSEASAPQEGPPLVAGPELTRFVQADYPPDAQAAGLEGTVILRLTIDETGAVVDVALVQPAGHGFDEAATEAARQFVFSPARDTEGPVAVVLDFAYGFELKPAPAPEPVPEPLAPFNLDGTVLQMGTRTPLAGARVWIDLPPGPVETRTDEQGHWELRCVAPGTITVHAEAMGHDATDEKVEVVEGEVTEVRLWLRDRGDADNVIVGTWVRPEEANTVTRYTITMAEVYRVPGTFGDPVRIVQSLPGSARAPFSFGVLIIRGANPADSNVYIDGVEVPAVFHLGGYRSILNPALIESVDYLPGGYPVRYGRSTGGVIDVRTTGEHPERWHASWRTDLLDTSVALTGRTASRGLAFAVRRSYIDAFIPFLAPDDLPSIKPRWFDYQVKSDPLKPDDDGLSLFAFGFQDVLFIDNAEGFSQGSDDAEEKGLSAVNQTHRVVGTWRRALGASADLVVQPVLGWDGTRFGLGEDIEVDQSSWRLGTRAEVDWRQSERWRLRGGLDASTYHFGVDVLLRDMPALNQKDPLAEDDDFSTDDRGWVFAPDPWVDVEVRPAHDALALSVNLGLRLTTRLQTNDQAIVGVDPRLSARWQVRHDGVVKGGTGLYHQPAEDWRTALLGNTDPALERAWSTELGWEQRFGAWGSADLTTFFKRMGDLMVTNPDLADPRQDPVLVPEGAGRVLGAELLLRKEPTGPLFGWVSYTLSRSTRNDTPAGSDGGEWYVYDFDQTHILTLVGGTALPRAFELSGRFQYVTGDPYTPYTDAIYTVDTGGYTPVTSESTNSARLLSYVALDLRASKRFTFKRWRLEAFLDVLNALHGTNPERVLYSYDYTEQSTIKGLPLIPSPGVSAEFDL